MVNDFYTYNESLAELGSEPGSELNISKLKVKLKEEDIENLYLLRNAAIRKFLISNPKCINIFKEEEYVKNKLNNIYNKSDNKITRINILY